VPVDRTRDEIQKELTRYGVKEYGFGVSPRGTGIIFKWKDRVYRLNVNDPSRRDFSSQQRYDQAVRSRWRVLLLCIKAKLNVIEDGDKTFEDEFMAYMALPDGSTVGDFLKLPENQARLAQSQMPLLLMAEQKGGE